MDKKCDFAQRLLAVADELTQLAAMLQGECCDGIFEECHCDEQCCPVENPCDAECEAECAEHCTDKCEKEPNNQCAESCDEVCHEPCEEACQEPCDEKCQTPKREKVCAKPLPKNSRQIGGGLNGILSGGFNMQNLPGLGNLFGGMGGLGGLSGLSNAPKSVEEVMNNPQIMSVLGSLENNPALLNTVAAMSGMDKEKIVESIKNLQNSAPDSAESVAEPTAAGSNLFGNFNLSSGLNSLGDLSKLFGGGQGAVQPQPMMANAMAGTAPLPLALRSSMGGDPLTNLLKQWHWLPFRS